MSPLRISKVGAPLNVKSGSVLVTKEVPGTLWTPADTTTLLWLDASDTGTITKTCAGDPVECLVSQWDDKSGNNSDITQSTASAQPTTDATTQNDLNVIDFTDASDTSDAAWMDITTPTGLDFRDVYIVAKWTGGDYDGLTVPFYYAGLFWGGGTGVADRGLGFNATGSGWWPGAGGSWWDNLLMNGAALVGYPPDNFADVGLVGFSADSAVDVDGYRIGEHGNYGPNRTWVGWVGEIVAFSSKLGDDDREIMEGYLAHKWGIAGHLPADHPYKSAAPTV